MHSLTYSSKIIQYVLLLSSTNNGTSTIKRRFNGEFGFKVFKPTKKPTVTSFIKAERLAFEKANLGWMTEK